METIDVKSQKPKAATAGGINKTKKIEDDAWDLLNNWFVDASKATGYYVSMCKQKKINK